MRKHYLFILLCVFTLLTNCTGGGDDPAIATENTNSTVVKTGKVTGKVMSQNGTKPIGGASVFTFDEKYKIYHTTSDADGNFTLEAPVGNHTIHIQTGNGSNFRTEISATVKDNETLSLDAN